MQILLIVAFNLILRNSLTEDQVLIQKDKIIMQDSSIIARECKIII